MSRYHPFMVALHWLVALMIFMSLVIGGPALTEMSNDDPEKLFGLTGHMIFGMVIGLFMILRLIARMLTSKPAPADAGNAALNTGAKLAHMGLYVLVLAMVASGVGIAVSADLFAIAVMQSGAPLPADFNVFTARAAHGMIATLLMLLVIAHILGWAYHQFILRDGLIKRMWFGKRQ